MKTVNRKVMLQAASRLLKQSQVRRDFALASDDPDENFTSIVTCHTLERVTEVVRMAKNAGLDPKLYDQNRVAVTGKREKVLSFQAALRKTLYGPDLSDESASVCKDLSLVNELLPPGRKKTEVLLAMQDLSTDRGISKQRVQKYKDLALSLK